MVCHHIITLVIFFFWLHNIYLGGKASLNTSANFFTTHAAQEIHTLPVICMCLSLQGCRNGTEMPNFPRVSKDMAGTDVRAPGRAGGGAAQPTGACGVF